MIPYLTAWLLTIFIEFVILWIIIRKEPLKLWVYSFLINSFTWPIALYSYQNILDNFYIIEISVIMVESVLLMLLLRIKYLKALLISVVANVVTSLLGVLFSLI